MGAAPAQARAAKKTVNVGDNFFTPKTRPFKPGGTVTWDGPGSTRRVTSTMSSSKRPKGAKKFESEAASTDYSFKRRLTVKGRTSSSAPSTKRCCMTMPWPGASISMPYSGAFAAARLVGFGARRH